MDDRSTAASGILHEEIGSRAFDFFRRARAHAPRSRERFPIVLIAVKNFAFDDREANDDRPGNMESNDGSLIGAAGIRGTLSILSPSGELLREELSHEAGCALPFFPCFHRQLLSCTRG